MVDRLFGVFRDCRERQPKGEARAFTLGATQLEGPTVLGGDPGRDRQAQPTAGCRGGVAAAVEPFEDPVPVFGWYAEAGVGDIDPRVHAVAPCRIPHLTG